MRLRVDDDHRALLCLCHACLTARDGDGYSNLVAGLDAEWRITAADRIEGQLLRSSTEYPATLAPDYDQPEGSFDDWAGELAYFGAKVLHPRTMRPLIAHAIPLHIKNSFSPTATGTIGGHAPPPTSTTSAPTSTRPATARATSTPMIVKKPRGVAS